MRTNTYSILLAAALAAAGCSSVKTHVDTGPITARTFSFLNTGPKERPAYADKRTQVYTMINEAITRNLAGNNATTTSLNDYFGYTDDAAKLVDKVHTEQAIKDQDRNYFEEGTLVIDIISPQTMKLLKRTAIQSPILRNLAPDVRQARIQSFVDQALSGLRISK